MGRRRAYRTRRPLRWLRALRALRAAARWSRPGAGGKVWREGGHLHSDLVSARRKVAQTAVTIAILSQPTGRDKPPPAAVFYLRRGWSLIAGNDRRLFLAIAGALVAMPPPARALAPTSLRRVKLHNANTGESFDGPYRDDRGPIAAAMEELSHLLRDHRSGTRIAIDVGVID